jgi:hypothetical protein
MKDARQRIHAVALQAIDAAEAIVKRIATPVLDQPQVTTLRRQLANRLGLSQFCASNRCRRAHCCRGEPLDCLHVGLPLLPDALIERLKMAKPRRGAAR